MKNENLPILTKNSLYYMKDEIIADLVARDKENLAMAYKICQDNTLKHDLVQDMYLKMITRINDGLHSKLLSSGYIFIVLKNLWIDQTRSYKEFLVYSDELRTMEITDEEAEIVLSDRKELSRLLDEIPYLEREVLLRHQEISQRALSRETGVNRDRLRMYKNNALDKLIKLAKESELWQTRK